jgi:membrane-associated protease RseP (regulator of RpoE activity)
MYLDIIAMFIGLLIALFVHELGHCVAGRWCGMRVLAVSIGVGPPLLKLVDRSGTHWRLRLLPIGGASVFDERVRKQPLAWAAVLAAGPIFSLIYPLWMLAGLHLMGKAPFASGAELSSDAAVVLTVALFSVLVAVVNSLPLPPLDGGQLMLVAMERWRGRALAKEAHDRINGWGRTALACASLVAAGLIISCWWWR